MRYVVIMAGGSGTRLWPLSRQETPKQLPELFDGWSLLRFAYERVAGMIPDARTLVCMSRAHVDVVAQQFPELSEENLLGEPVGWGSLGVVAWSAAVLERRDPEVVVAMLSADHIVTPVEGFRTTLGHAFDVAETRPRALVTMGVVPTEPHTGFGYLHRDGCVNKELDAWQVSGFKEKPELRVAEHYLASREYWWNAGMFVWRVETLLDQLEVLIPDTAKKVRIIAAHNELLDELFPALLKTSIGYAVMQPVSLGEGNVEVPVVGLDVSWADVGSHQNLAEQFLLDKHGNRVGGCSMNLDSPGCVIINTAGERHVMATMGLWDALVVHTPEATLVTPLSGVGRIRELVELVCDRIGAEYAWRTAAICPGFGQESDMTDPGEGRTRGLSQTEDRRDPGSGLSVLLVRVGLGRIFNLQLNQPSGISAPRQQCPSKRGDGSAKQPTVVLTMGTDGRILLGIPVPPGVANDWGNELDLPARPRYRPTRRTGLTRRNRMCVIWVREGVKRTTPGRWG